MSGFLKNLKGLFIASDEDLVDAAKDKGEKSGKTSTASSDDHQETPDAGNAAPISIPIEGDGEVNQEFLDILLESMTQSNQQGYDYLEYKQALRSLKKMEMDEATRFKSAFVMAETMGANKAKLMKSAEEYLAGLQDEHKKFLQSVANQRKVKIDERKQELLRIEKWIKEKEAEIQLMKEKIEAKKKSKDSIQGDLADTARKIDRVEQDFRASYTFLSGQIKDDLEKIKTILK